MKKLKAFKYELWDEYNPEGIRGKDAFGMLVFVIGGFIITANLMLWITQPEQSWLGKLLFPMAN